MFSHGKIRAASRVSCDGQVQIHEVITGVGIAIGLLGIESCEAADGNDDGQVLINEVITAANNGLSGCLP